MDAGNKTVLLVDDDLFTAELTGMLLEMEGYTVLMAEGGPDALEKLSANRSVALLISDMNMPFMTGIELFEELQQQGCQIPFVLLTGEDADPYRTSYPGLAGVLSKDEQLQDSLPALVNQLLDG